MSAETRTDTIPVFCPCHCGESVSLDIGRQSDEWAIVGACSLFRKTGVTAFKVSKIDATNLRRSDR